MIENNLKNTIKELKAELLLKNKEISEYLDKIEYLEDTIMEFEVNLSEESDKTNVSLLKIHLKDREKENRELKNKLGFLRLENVKLKQELEKIKKGHVINIQVVEDSLTSNELENVIKKEPKIKEDNISRQELFKYINIKCPRCDTPKRLKIPEKIINQSQHITTISIPKGMVCEHSFQAFADKYFTIISYQVVDFESSNMEYYKNIEEKKKKKEDLTHFTSLPFFQDLINLLKSSIDDRDVLGTAIFTNRGEVIYASVPSNISFNIIEEFEVRKEKKKQNMIKMFIELENHQKFYSENIEVQNTEFILVLILSRKVNFGMGSMLFRNIKKKIKTINSKS